MAAVDVEPEGGGRHREALGEEPMGTQIRPHPRVAPLSVELPVNLGATTSDCL